MHEPFDLDRYAGAVVAAFVHTGKHEPEIVDFVKRHRDKLEEMKAAFVSVSLSEARAEDKRQSEDDRSKATADVQGVIDKFLAETGGDRSACRPSPARCSTRSTILSSASS